MIRSVKLTLGGGYYDIAYGADFGIKSDAINHMVYEKNGVWNVISEPGGGMSGNVTIILPTGMEFKSFVLRMNGGAVKIPDITAEKFYVDIKNSAGEIMNVDAVNMGISMGKGNLRIGANPAKTLDIDCGFGEVDVNLKRGIGEYSFMSKCGIGKVMLNSKTLPHEFFKSAGEIQINTVCGMGEIHIKALE